MAPTVVSRPSRLEGRTVVSSVVRRFLGPADRLGQSPIDHERLAKPAEHDVRGFDVAMNDPPIVGIRHGVANIQEPPARDLGTRQSREAESDARVDAASMIPLDRCSQTFALDEPHGILGLSIGILAQTVHGDDARMLESSGDLGLSDESHAGIRLVCGSILDSLECDITIQLLVAGDKDRAQCSFGVKP